MPVINISKIPNLLVGLCCLKGEEHENVHSWWQDRFANNMAFLIDIEQDTTPKELLEQLEQAVFSQGIHSIQGQSVILAFFYDLTEEINPDWLDSIWNLQKRLDQYFKTNTVLSIQFGYVGKLNLTSASKQRQTAKAMIERNARQAAAVQHRLFLIAKPSLSGRTLISWKAAIVLLDVLRRQSSPPQLLPNTDDGNQNNDVAFLRYEEFDEKEWNTLVNDCSDKEHLLYDYDKQGFIHQLNRLVSDFKQKATDQFQINGEAQPQHSGVLLDRAKKRFLCDPIKKAKSGNNQEYNLAKDETFDAVALTAKRLQQSIESLYQPIVAKAPKLLTTMLADAKVGIKLKRNRDDMHALIDAISIDPVKVPSLLLNYSEEGLADEIQTYLNAVKASAINAAVSKLRKAMIDAYDSITEAELVAEEIQLSSDLDEVKSKLANLQTASDFCNSIAFQRDPAICNFTCNTGSGNNVKILLCRDKRMSELLAEAEKAGAVGASLFEISEHGGGVRRKDDAPLKAIQVVVLDGTEPVLEALLPDVEE